jgi:hypothetical protein
MAARGLHNSTDLSPLLKERGIELSASQVYRLLTQRPERVSLMMIAALCDIFTCDTRRPGHRHGGGCESPQGRLRRQRRRSGQDNPAKRARVIRDDG